MFTLRYSFAALLLLCSGALLPASVHADQYSDAANVFRGTDAAKPFFASSYGYAIFPTVGKGGFILAGGFGKGRVFVAGSPVGDTTLTQASVGLQVGGQAYTQIIFFEDERAFREFSRGGFEFGAQVNATVIKANAQATAGTTGSTAGASGGTKDVEGALMFEASVGGQRFSYKPLTEAVGTVERVEEVEVVELQERSNPPQRSGELAPGNPVQNF